MTEMLASVNSDPAAKNRIMSRTPMLRIGDPSEIAGVAAFLARRWPAWRSPLFAAAAGLGMMAAVRAVDAVAPMPAFIDATRGLPGLLAMAVGAVLAGWLYARLTRTVS